MYSWGVLTIDEILLKSVNFAEVGLVPAECKSIAV